MSDTSDDTDSNIFIPAPIVTSNVENIPFENVKNVLNNNSDKS